MLKNGRKYFLNLYIFMDNNEVWFSRSTFLAKSQEENYRVFYLVDVGQNRRFKLKLTFSSLSSTLILNTKYSQRDFPRAQTSISRLKSHSRHSHLPNNGSTVSVAYAAVTAITVNVDTAVAVE